MRRHVSLGFTLWLTLIAASAAGASNHAASIKPWKPTAQELALLPAYCQDRFRFGTDRSNPRILRWYRTFGEDFIHIHHYCAGLNFLRRADGTVRDQNLRKFELQRAWNNFTYIVEHAKQSTLLRAGSHYYRGRTAEKQHDTAAAAKEYLTAIRTLPRYLPPYSALADLYLRRGDRRGAREILKQGLRARPDSSVLRRKLAALEREVTDREK